MSARQSLVKRAGRGKKSSFEIPLSPGPPVDRLRRGQCRTGQAGGYLILKRTLQQAAGNVLAIAV
jgi:hypothetical protein